MADPRISIAKTIGIEKGYAHLQGDVGGRTIWGIAENFWPQYWPNGVPPTKETAFKFYELEFWSPLRLDEVASQAVANELLDSAVNLGMVRPVVWLQESLNKLRREYTFKGIPWVPLKVDGRIGPATIAATNEYTARSATHEKALFAALEGYQIMKYLDESQPQFVRGHLAQRTEQWDDPS